MKIKQTNKIVIQIMMVAFALLLVSCTCENEKHKEIDANNVEKTLISLSGMNGKNSEASIGRVAFGISGVVGVEASSIQKNVIVEFDNTQTDADTIEKIIGESGIRTLGNESYTDKEAQKEIPPAMKCAPGKCGVGKCGGME